MSHINTFGANTTSCFPKTYLIVSFTSKEANILGVIPNTCGFLTLKLNKYVVVGSTLPTRMYKKEINI